jgi:hypothetical protein
VLAYSAPATATVARSRPAASAQYASSTASFGMPS